ncbi:MAG: DUF3857 domain-containing protein [Chloroflexia bacterium]|nr:DUF3857 domain-containing protein [Chloroflexia bacterium]
MVESPLNKKELYNEKTGNYQRLTFAFPNVKVGSVIECSYTISTGSVFSFYPWSFQHSIPVVYSEYNAVFPGVFRYKFDGHYENIKVNFSQTSKDLRLGSIMTSEMSYKWTSGHVPAFKPEPFMASENDYISRVEFELAGLDLPGRYEEITPTYEKLTQKLLEDDNFGGPLNKSAYLDKKVKEITNGIEDDLEKIKVIHKFITQNVKWNEETGIFTTSPSFKKIIRNQNGSAADINLLFVAMLMKAGITSCPVVLSTRENGSLNPYYAIITKFDYVVAWAKVNDKEYLMDATDETRPFNELPSECLNGNGRTIHPRMSKWIPLYNNEQEFDQVTITAELNSNNELVCEVQRVFGGYSAFRIRKALQTTGNEGFISLLKSTSGDKEYSDFVFQNQDNIEKSLIINYKVIIKGAIQTTPQLCIINPVLFFARSENPFSNSERKFPIDFECPENELYTLNIKIPDFYTVEELPADINLKLEKNGAIFTYVPSVENNTVSLRYRFSRKETHFPTENFLGLKEFYTKFLKKQSDLIILKKKSIDVANQ